MTSDRVSIKQTQRCMGERGKGLQGEGEGQQGEGSRVRGAVTKHPFLGAWELKL